MTRERETKLKATCRLCETDYTFMVNEDDLRDWQGGQLIQRVMPYLNASERELLISGTCGDCFDRMFASEGEPEW